jgi:hypothetical protein
MKPGFVLAGVLIVGIAPPAFAIGAKDTYHIARDEHSNKCSVVKDNPATGKAGTGNTYESEADARAAIDKMADCAGK